MIEPCSKAQGDAHLAEAPRAAILLVALLMAFAPGVLVAVTPIPKATLIPVTPDSYPFGAANHTRIPEDLKAVGYVEEEFLVSGTANVYEWPEGGPAKVRTANAPYVTRVLVRRPRERSKFSGVVVVEMLNPSNLFDLNLAWAMTRRQFLRDGDAWVGITAKPVAVATLKKFNPTRYGALSWANPLPLDDPNHCGTVSRDSERTTENGLVWDIHSQVGAWLRSADPANPFRYSLSAGPSAAKHLYAWGYSQTGAFLYTYVNSIHPRDAAANGRPIYDAYLIAVAASPTPIHQCAGPLAAGDPRRQIRNAGVPVIHVMSQSDYLRAIPARRDDQDRPPDQFRHYELAGAGHATQDELNTAAAPADIERGGRAVPPMNCNEGPRSRFPSWLAFDAMFRNLDLWVRKGIAPPRADPIEVVNGAPVLDAFGNVKGGYRSPYVDVPASKWAGNSTGASFCMIAGHETPLTPEEFRKAYPTRAAYAAAFKKSVSALTKARFIVAEDGQELVKAEANQRPE
ncbi:MAG: alpha/beta hydrolase domain-containing protein [Bryobacteraceae bacterium]